MFKRIIASALLILFASRTLGQNFPPPPAEFDKSKAIAYALLGNAELRAAKLAIEIAEARLKRTGLRSNPEIVVDYASDFAFNDEGEYSLGVGLEQSFPLANRLKKAKAVSRVDIAKAKMEVRQQEREIANAISEIALEIQIMDTRVGFLERLRDKAREISSFVNSRVERGELSILEANQATLELRGLELEIHQLSDQRKRLARSLAPHFGLAPNFEIRFALTEAIDAKSALGGFDNSVFERHPEFQLAVLEAHSAEAEIALAESENWESITARVFWENERSVDEPVGLGTDRFIGLGVSIPIPLRKKGDLLAKEHRIALDQSRLEAAAIKLRIQHEIENARAEATNLQQRLEQYQENVVQLANDQLEETQRAYQNGQLSLVSLLRAQDLLLRLEKSYLDTLENYGRARLKLDLARIDIPELKSAN